MVTVYGLNDKIGNVSFYDSSGGNEYNFTKPYSEKTAEIIDQEVKKIIEKAYGTAIDILEQNKEKLTKLAEKLLEEEVIFKDDLLAIIGERPFEEEIEVVNKSVEKEIEVMEEDNNEKEIEMVEKEINGENAEEIVEIEKEGSESGETKS
jgi:cell division protease FtsH